MVKSILFITACGAMGMLVGEIIANRKDIERIDAELKELRYKAK